VGVLVELATLVVPSELKNTPALAILIIVLLVRPQGILGRSNEWVEGSRMDWGAIFENTVKAFVGINAVYFAIAAIGLNVQFGYTGC
jgi:ABC-type branched-subunit amino acid transport system permease subunit